MNHICPVVLNPSGSNECFSTLDETFPPKVFFLRKCTWNIEIFVYPEIRNVKWSHVILFINQVPSTFIFLFELINHDYLAVQASSVA